MNPDNTPDSTIGKRFHGVLSVQQQLESCATWEALWTLVEESESSLELHRYYGLMDVVVMEIASHLLDGAPRAARTLAHPPLWAALRLAVERAFPDNPERRLSRTALSRQQHHRARQALTGDTLDAFQRGVRREAARAATEIGLFDPAAGSWTHPDATQLIAGDAICMPAGTDPCRMAVPTGRVDDRQWVVVLVGGSRRTGPILLDIDVPAPHDGRAGRSDADQAVAMLRRLLDENRDILRGGLRGFVYDMSLSAMNLDDILGLGLLPIARVPRATGGDLRRGVIGMHSFIAADGTRHGLEVGAVAGAPVVEFADDSGAVTTVALRRRQTLWTGGSRRVAAYGRYEIPAAATGVPAHLGGAKTTIRLNSIRLGTQGAPSTRRTHLVRPIPEADDDFDRLYSIRERVEALSVDLKHRGGPHGLRTRFHLIAYQILCTVRALKTRDNRASGQAA